MPFVAFGESVSIRPLSELEKAHCEFDAVQLRGCFDVSAMAFVADSNAKFAKRVKL